MFLIILLNACNNVETIQHIEVFVVETSQQGFKKVNAITSIEEGKNYMKTDIKAIEDFYDMEGNYIKTEIIHSTGNKTYVSPAIEGDTRKEELQEPSTILIPDEVIKSFKIDNLTKDEEVKVKKHILSFMDLL
jgi:hypothetical protein